MSDSGRILDLVPAACNSVLEIQCASGTLGERLKQRYPGISHTVVPLAGLDWSRFAGRGFDCVILGDALERLVDPAKNLTEAARLVGEKGSVICDVANIGRWSTISGLLEGKWSPADSAAPDQGRLRYFTVRTFKSLLEECGLMTAQEERVRVDASFPQEIMPFLQKMDLDVQAFLDRITTARFFIRAEKVPKAVAKFPSSWDRGGSAAQSVAVVIPVFNKVELTRDCLDSISKHYPKNASPEVIVFDNASSDGTQAYLAEAQRQYDWLKVIRSETNLGFARACNKGAELCDADIMVFLNNDTLVLPMWLDRMLDRINDPKVGMIGSKLIYPNGSIQHAGMVFNAEATPTHIHHLANHADAAVNRMMEYPAVTGACIMIKRPLFMELGCMDIEYPMYYEDVDLCFKVREKGLKVIYQPESVVVHLEGQSSANFQAIVSHNQVSKGIFLKKWREFMLREIAADPIFYGAGKEYFPNA